jgi:hypothetical protein
MPTDPATRLYDCACDVLLAVQDLTAAAHQRDVASAVPATLGCLSEALAEMSRSSAAMREALERDRPESGEAENDWNEALRGLAVALEDARRAGDLARTSVFVARAESSKARR